VAVEAGIETYNAFFNESTAKEIKEQYGTMDLVLARHVFAHVPEIHGFVKALKNLLAPNGVIAIEAPYLIDLVEKKNTDDSERFRYRVTYKNVTILWTVTFNKDLKIIAIQGDDE
jgi:novobiocin biosynthesis protein NovU/D-mycarose 3-C-methyltransferase